MATRLPGATPAAREGVVRLWEAAGRPGRLHVLHVGACGGEFGRSLLRWADRVGVGITITLLEPSRTECGRTVDRFAGERRIQVAQGDMQRLQPASADVVAATLVLRRLPSVQIPWTLLHWREAARIGVVAVDLHRHPAASAGLTLLTRLLFRDAMLRRAPSLAAPWGFRADDVAELRSYPGLEGLRYLQRPWFCCQITLGGDPPPCGMWSFSAPVPPLRLRPPRREA